MSKKRVYIAIHILTWILLSVIPFIFVGNTVLKEKAFFIRWYTNTLLNAGIFYIFYGYINNRFLTQQNIFRFLGISALVIPIYCVFRYFVSLPIYLNAENYPSNTFIAHFFGSIFFSGFFVGLAIFVSFTENWFVTQQYRQKVEKEKLESELKMLRNQVNPHFLFNTLNNIHTLVYKKSDKASDAIMKLSGLMRYMLYETNSEIVLLEKELEYLKNYVELQRLRFTNPNQVNFTVEGDSSNKTIAPLLLVPFIENAFKHGLSAGNTSSIDIRINISESVLTFYCSNGFKSGADPDIHSGIGLNNVEKRLNLLYNNRHSLKINKLDNRFEVNLSLTF